MDAGRHLVPITGHYGAPAGETRGRAGVENRLDCRSDAGSGRCRPAAARCGDTGTAEEPAPGCWSHPGHGPFYFSIRAPVHPHRTSPRGRRGRHRPRGRPGRRRRLRATQAPTLDLGARRRSRTPREGAVPRTLRHRRPGRYGAARRLGDRLLDRSTREVPDPDRQAHRRAQGHVEDDQDRDQRDPPDGRAADPPDRAIPHLRARAAGPVPHGAATPEARRRPPTATPAPIGY